MPEAKAAVHALAASEGLDLVSSPLDESDSAVLYACYKTAAIPNLIHNFFRHYKTNTAFWPALFDPPPPSALEYNLTATEVDSLSCCSAVAALLTAEQEMADEDPWTARGGWRSVTQATRTAELESSTGETVQFQIAYTGDAEWAVTVRAGEGEVQHKVTVTSAVNSTMGNTTRYELNMTVDEHVLQAQVELDSKNVHSVINGVKHHFLIPSVAYGAAAVGGGACVSPMAGTVTKLFVQPGDVVKKGDVLVVVEAMKMENALRASSDGTVGEVNTAQGDFAEGGKVLVTLIVSEEE
jgi:acetyl/propionyl-CoA carboxylase alpha subunit